MRARLRNCLIKSLVVGVLFQLFGCGPQNIVLRYPPDSEEVLPEVTLQSRINERSASRDIFIEVFDARAEKDRLSDDFVGIVITKYGAPESSENVRIWVTEALEYELEQAGYVPQRQATLRDRESMQRLTVDIQRAYSDSPIVGSEIVLQATLERPESPLVIGHYRGRGKLQLVVTASSLAESLADGLREALLTMMTDLKLTGFD